MQYKQSNITPRFPDDSNSILRKEMMEHFIKKMPTVKKEFYNAIPLTLRENTDGRQMQFLEDILEIIEEHAD
jgi:DNA-binding ferritin-like protein